MQKKMSHVNENKVTELVTKSIEDNLMLRLKAKTLAKAIWAVIDTQVHRTKYKHQPSNSFGASGFANTLSQTHSRMYSKDSSTLGAKSPIKENSELPQSDNNMFDKQWTIKLFNHKVNYFTFKFIGVCN
jgi:hypothetical protein